LEFDYENDAITAVSATVTDEVWNGWTPVATLQDLPVGDIE
jgi:hypothetical protein